VTRARLDAQLHEINAKIIHLGTLVATALEQALQAVQSRDLALCTLVIEADQMIDSLRFDAERLAFQSLTLQQPLAGRDLRFLSSVPLITGDLERMGDNATGIATLLLRMAPLWMEDRHEVHIDLSAVANGNQKHLSDHTITEHSIICELLDLGQEARRVLQGTMKAFEQSDAAAARLIWQEDDIIDIRYHQVRHNVMTMLAGIQAIPALQYDALIMQRMTYWLWIAHKLERAGDHCTNICERITFFLEGDRMIHPQESVYKDL
jgi:phosphate transport system protein